MLCSRVWPHLVQFSNLHNLECHIQLRPQVRNGLFEFQGFFFIPTRRISNKYQSASQIFCTSGSINFGRIFIIYAPNESSWKSSITKYHSQSCVGTLNHANWSQIALLEHSFLMFTWLANGLSLKYWVLCSRVWPNLVQFTNLHNLQCYMQLRQQVRNGLSLKYRVLCFRVWPHLVQFINLHNLQCYTQLRPQVRNALSLKYRVLCSRVWPHLVQFTNLHNLQCYTQLRPQVRNGLSLKYRVLCSRVWPHLGEFTNYITLVII